MESFSKKNQTFKLEYEILTASGKRKWVIEIGKCIFNKDDEIEALEGIILDINNRKKAEQLIMYNYEHDSFTGLYSRSYLDNLLIHDHNKQKFIKRAFMSINLSTVQALSLTYGYNYTQEFIKNIAIVLNKYSTENYILTRSFENRFVYYIKGYKDKDELMKFSQQIANDLKQILASERIGASIGIFEINSDEELDLNQLSKKVLITSEKAIELEENEIGICYYDKKIEQEIEQEEIIKRELTNITSLTEYEGLYLQYQPIFDLKTNKISGFEALARLNTRELGRIPPAIFIPLAEQTKLIVPLGWIITSKAFDFLNRLKSLGFNNTNISINFSIIQLMKDDFIDKLSEMINIMQIDPHNIGIEITESVFTSGYDDINIIMKHLKNL